MTGNEQPIISQDQATFWLGMAAHYDQDVVNDLSPRVPLIVFDTSEIEE